MGTLAKASLFSRKRKGAPFCKSRKRVAENVKGFRSNPVTAVRIRQGLFFAFFQGKRYKQITQKNIQDNAIGAVMNAYMNPLDCRFSGKYSPQNREKKFPAALLKSGKTFAGSRLIDQNPKLSGAAREFKQLAREQLRQPAVMEFIGRCLTRAPQEFGQLLVSPDAKVLAALVKEAMRLQPENKLGIIRPASVAIELMNMRNRMLFEGPQSAFSYYASDPNAQKLRSALGSEMHSILIGLHQPGQHGHFIFHPKITALREILYKKFAFWTKREWRSNKKSCSANASNRN